MKHKVAATKTRIEQFNQIVMKQYKIDKKKIYLNTGDCQQALEYKEHYNTSYKL